MKRVVRRVLAAATAVAIMAAVPRADAAAASFRRGATLVEFFIFPKTTGEGPTKAYANPPYPDVAVGLNKFKFDQLRQLGFDHMRVPIEMGPLMWGDESTRRSILQQLHIVIAELHRHGLGVLVTLHPPSLNRELPETYLDGLEGPKFTLYLSMVERIAGELGSIRSGAVGLEPMNEPQDACRAKTGPDWTVYQELMVERIRRISSDLRVFLTGGCWSNIEGIVLLDSDLLRDRRNSVSVHFYYPFLFTHQGATWTMPYLAGTTGISYPASAGNEASALFMTRQRFKTVPLAADADRDAALRKAEHEIKKYFSESQGPSAMAQWMQQMANWQKRQGVHSDQIVFTEFGAMKQLDRGIEYDKASRARWLRDASSMIEGHSWGWTVYVLRDDPFGLYEQKSDDIPAPALLRALRLHAPDDANHGATRASDR
jgi:endoglucanase